MPLISVAYGRKGRPFSVIIPDLPEDTFYTVGLIGHLRENKRASELIRPLEAMVAAGNVWLVSLNFSETVRDRLLASEDFRRSVQQRINNWLPKIGATLYLFVLEQADERWHLHGVVAYPLDQQAELHETLKRVTGKSPDQHVNSRLVHLQLEDVKKSFGSQRGIGGWALYIAKRLSQSSKALGNRNPVLSRGKLKVLVE